MREITKENRNAALINSLLDVWEKSVKETHTFLSSEEIENIKKYVPQALSKVTNLVIETDESNISIAYLWGLKIEN